MRRSVLAAALALLLTPLAPVQAASPGEILVCPDCPQRDLAAAIAAAPAGAVIRVRGGHYPGPLVIDRPVTLLGEDWPIIDGGGRSTVVHVAA
ncbi:MAG: nitrous oxide reductase family maturation protein NosD, partial [Thermomicrobium sp.]|nr:nitrous oxide reductase family maturation protein NosD [Thermomicrobium sp.]